MKKTDYGLLLSEPIYLKQEEYWLDQLSGELNATGFMPDFHRTKRVEKKELEFTIPNDIWTDLVRISKKMEMSVYLILLTCLKSLILFHTGNEDIAVVSPVYKANRTKQTLNQSIVIRNSVTADLTFKQLLLQIRETALEAYDHQDFPFEKILESLEISQEIDHLFNIACLLKNIHDQAGLDQLQSNIAFTFEIFEESLQAAVVYNSELYNESTIKQLYKHYISLLQQILKNPQIKLSEITILSAEEEQKILVDFNNTQVEYPIDQTLHQLFEKQVERTPDSIAVVFGEEQLTYQELNIRANQLATTLREKGVKPDQIVAIMVERSLEMMIGIMGILKAGGAYLPISPDYPVDRITYMLGDSGTEILLTHKGFVDQIESSIEIFDLEDGSLYVGEGANLQWVNTSQDLAYVIYTSGSTGRPKGVMIEHAGVINRLNWMVKKYSFGSDDIILQKTPFTFDVSVWELFGWTLVGAKLSLLVPEGEKDPSILMESIQKQGVTRIHFVPSMLNLFLQHIEECKEYSRLSSLKQVFASGEALTLAQVERFNNLLYENNTTRLSNLYGPTEATVEVSYFECSTGEKLERVPIGKPIDNTQLYVVDQNNQLCPVGVPGELCIAGDGVARGYINKPDLTAQKFVPNPFGPGQIYHTGDLTRWLPDGNIEFLGRIDFQVKIRGFRIELGEIENQILQHEAVKETIVVVKEDASGSKYMCAYLVGDRELTVTELRSHLAQQLPAYMIPAYFIQLDQMPLNHNGKINRKAFPEPTSNLKMGGEYIPPTNAIEERLVAIWQEVLGVEGIGIGHNFFEVGGHSLKAAEIVSRIHKELNIAVPLSILFEHTSIKEVASCLADMKGQNQFIHSKGATTFSDIQLLPKQEYYELSYNQKRLWIISQLEPNSRAYNLPGRITLDEEVDEKLVIKAINHLVDRHESLRTQFIIVEGEPVQVINSSDSIQLQILDLAKISKEERSAHREMIFEKIINEPFIMVESPLLRVALVKSTQSQFDLIFCMHHIISDGWSMEILEKEFHLLYRSYKTGQVEKLIPLTVQYKDFASWQNRLIADSGNNQQAREYWLNKFSNGFPILNLPQDYSNTLEDRKSAGYRIVLSEEMKDQLKEIANQQNTSLFMVMATVLKMFLADLTGQEEVAIGVPSSGRQNQNLMNLIGFFINTIVLINRVNPESSFEQMLETIQQDTLKALEYQDYPLELITDELKIQYPRIQVFFNMLNMGQNHLQTLEDTEAYHIDQMYDVKFDIMFYLTEYANGIQVICTYLTGLYKPQTIEYLVGEYIRWISMVLRNEEETWDDGFVDDDDDDLILIRG